MIKKRSTTNFIDEGGQPIHAHGGCLLKHNDWFYWYGEDRRADYYVSCYRSKNLRTWEFRRHILTTRSVYKATRVKSAPELIRKDHSKVNIERPKVIYNALTKRFVLWAHFENGKDYSTAAVAVASSATPDGQFTYHGHFRPFGFMSRDCTLFQDGQQAYFISTARNNADIHIYKLSEDYLNVARLSNRLWPNEYREAPAMFKKDDLYYCVTSGTTGWRPNQSMYSTATQIDGDWTDLKPFGNVTTYHSQPAFLFEHGDQLFYIGDRWGGEGHYLESTYVVFPVAIDGRQLKLNPMEVK